MSASWGPQVWAFFHTIAEKVDAGFFIQKRETLINIIKQIASLLPCPICREHALQNLTKINFAYITTKERYIQFLFEFHNIVNRMLNKPEFAENKLEQYKSYNLEKVWQNFYAVMYRNYFNQRNLNESMLRRKMLSEIQLFLITNKRHFQI